jgi:hypothetical protein
MKKVEERQAYAKANISSAVSLENKVKVNKRSSFLKGHSAALALAIRLGFSTTVEAHDAGHGDQLKAAFKGK